MHRVNKPVKYSRIFAQHKNNSSSLVIIEVRQTRQHFMCVFHQSCTDASTRQVNIWIEPFSVPWTHLFFYFILNSSLQYTFHSTNNNNKKTYFKVKHTTPLINWFVFICKGSFQGTLPYFVAIRCILKHVQLSLFVLNF